MGEAIIITQTPDVIHKSRDFLVDQAIESAIAIADFCQSNAANIDRNGAFAQREFELIAQADLLTAPLQADFGGWGAGFNSDVMYETLMLLKHIGRGNLAVGRVYEGHVNGLQLIQTLGSLEQIATYAEDTRRGKIFGVWNAEASDGVKVIPVDNCRYRLEGAKTFCSGAGFVERPFVNGLLPDGGWQMCIVPMEKVTTISDESWWEPPGMKATASYKIDFTGVELTQNDLIGQPGDYYRQPWLTAGVIRFAAVQLGGAEAIFDATREFLRLLQRTEDAYQKQRLGKMAIAIESGNLWLKGAAEMITAYAEIFGDYPTVTNPQAEQLVAYTNMVRTAIEQICIDIMQLCERCVGTRGLLPPHPMERLIRDLTLYLRQPAFDIAIANPGEYSATQTKSVYELWK